MGRPHSSELVLLESTIFRETPDAFYRRLERDWGCFRPPGQALDGYQRGQESAVQCSTVYSCLQLPSHSRSTHRRKSIRAFFMLPLDTARPSGAQCPAPTLSSQIHNLRVRGEAELVVSHCNVCKAGL